jgi:hypothetical protein
MGNRRVSELSPITAAEVAVDDLFLLADVSAIESKKLTASELGGYLQTYVSASATSSLATNAKTASYLLYQGFVNGTASYALTSSFNFSSSHARWADTSSYTLFALSASYAHSSSYALSASYAATSSVQLIYSSAFADYAKSASFLIYTGILNGTASYAMTASRANNARTASFLIGPLGSGAAGGTASFALSCSLARSASFLRYDGVTNNGTASYAWNARSASNATTVTTITNQYIYREYDPITSNINGQTASFGWMQFTASGVSANIIVESYGDILVPITNSVDFTSSLELVMENSGARFSLDTSTFQYYYTSSSEQVTGSNICSFYLKGKFVVTAPAAQRFSGSVMAYNNISFFTSSRAVRCNIKATTDNFTTE